MDNYKTNDSQVNKLSKEASKFRMGRMDNTILKKRSRLLNKFKEEKEGKKNSL